MDMMEAPSDDQKKRQATSVNLILLFSGVARDAKW
jgi:hypothetical protein